jgi:phosphopentomutase
MRAFILVMDSVGIGGAPDAAFYGDAGANTLGHIAEACARGNADSAERAGPLAMPNLVSLGLGNACALATGRSVEGLAPIEKPQASYGCAREISKGKDTPSGHWELAGLPVLFDWAHFPEQARCFPATLIDALCERAELPGVLGQCHASGTEIIAQLGQEHIRTQKPICYTSADSVFQIAAHEEAFGLERLYEVCRIAQTLTEPLNIGRVIARPFVGTAAENFRRTENRRDFTMPPPAPTILDLAIKDHRDVITVGKIGDIFAHSGTGRVLKGAGNDALFDRTLQGCNMLADGGLLFANFIDFDSLYGHRRDTAGYALALEKFDSRIPDLLGRMKADDLLVITADHGCDPTWRGTDHTREQVPLIVHGGPIPHTIGRRSTFADVGKSVAEHIELRDQLPGSSFLSNSYCCL